MPRERHVELHLTVDEGGNPLSAFVLEEDERCQLQWLADREFAPFDPWVQVTLFLRRAISDASPVRPG